MLEVSHLLRKAYIAKLNNLTYLGKLIPVYDEYEREGVLLPIGNTTQCIAYCLIKDITVNDDSPKCGISEDVSIQLQVVTKFNANTGENLYAELIGNLALLILSGGGNRVVVDVDPPFDNFIGRKISSRAINSETKTNRIFTKNYVFLHKISQ